MAPGVTLNDFDKNELSKSFSNYGSCRYRISKYERKKRKKQKRRRSAQWKTRRINR